MIVNSSTVRVPAVVFAGAKPDSLLTYAVALTNTPSSPTDWDVSIIDSVNHGNFYVSIAQTDKDQPIVSYTPYAYGVTSLWYARCEPLY